MSFLFCLNSLLFSYLNFQAGIFMGFSITSAVLGGVIIICYSIFIAFNQYYNTDREMAISVIILILGIVEVAIGIWVAVCLCLMKPCTCCYGNPPQQVSRPSRVGKRLFLISLAATLLHLYKNKFGFRDRKPGGSGLPYETNDDACRK